MGHKIETSLFHYNTKCILNIFYCMHSKFIKCAESFGLQSRIHFLCYLIFPIKSLCKFGKLYILPRWSLNSFCWMQCVSSVSLWRIHWCFYIYFGPAHYSNNAFVNNNLMFHSCNAEVENIPGALKNCRQMKMLFLSLKAPYTYL